MRKLIALPLALLLLTFTLRHLMVLQLTATDTTIRYTDCTGDTIAQGSTGTETYSIFGNTLTIVSGGIR